MTVRDADSEEVAPMSLAPDSLASVLLETYVLQDNDADLPGLLASGFVVVGESWGAQLRLTDPADEARLRQSVTDAYAGGTRILELGVADATDIVALEQQTTPDYPYTPATAHRAPSLDEVLEWPRRRMQAFGARADDGTLLAVSAGRETEEEGERLGDHDFVSVDRAHRGRGLAKAVVAAWILALADDGVRHFTTGGAAQNSSSLGMVRALGFTVDERWLSLQRP